ncbi:hypothetical protein [Streptomyces daliensis]|uniref:Uncharacterized protein n=1 Tax=Streptomyces daliensis TaxID=299421 RepID=A0A8T4J133_9ACTN|nr:hypothetical protein [Streptomyces daliensis]
MADAVIGAVADAVPDTVIGAVADAVAGSLRRRTGAGPVRPGGRAPGALRACATVA